MCCVPAGTRRSAPNNFSMFLYPKQRRYATGLARSVVGFAGCNATNVKEYVAKASRGCLCIIGSLPFLRRSSYWRRLMSLARRFDLITTLGRSTLAKSPSGRASIACTVSVTPGSASSVSLTSAKPDSSRSGSEPQPRLRAGSSPRPGASRDRVVGIAYELLATDSGSRCNSLYEPGHPSEAALLAASRTGTGAKLFRQKRNKTTEPSLCFVRKGREPGRSAADNKRSR